MYILLVAVTFACVCSYAQGNPFLKKEIIKPIISPLGAPDTLELGAPLEPGKSFFHVKQYSLQNGLFTHEVAQVCLDDLKRVWFISFTAGLGCIDGRHVYRYSIKQGLGDRFRHLTRTSNGDLWIGTNGYGLFRITQGEVHHYNIDVLPDVHMGKIVENADGSIWTTTAFGGVIRINGDTMWTIRDTLGFVNTRSAAVMEDSRGVIWTSGVAGVQVIDGGKLYKNEELKSRGGGRTIAEDREGSIWMSIRDKGVFIFEKGNYKNPEQVDIGENKDVNLIRQEEDGNVWLQKWNGLMYGNRNGFTELPSEVFLGDRSHIAGYQLKDGQLWVCIDQSISYVHDWAFSVPKEAHKAQYIRMSQAPNGDVWLGFKQGEVGFRQVGYDKNLDVIGLCDDERVRRQGFDDQGVRWGVLNDLSIGYFEDCNFRHVTSMTDDDKASYSFVRAGGYLWIPGKENLYLFKGKKLYKKVKGRGEHIAEGPDGNVFVILDGRLSRFDGKRWVDFEHMLPEHVRSTRVMRPDHQNRLFVGTWGAFVFEVVGDTILQRATETPTHIVRRMYKGSGSRLWICGQGTGLSLYNGKAFVGIGDLNHNISNDCWYVSEDSKKRIWIGTNEGYYRLDPKDVNDIVINSKEDVFKKYTIKSFRQQFDLFSLSENRLKTFVDVDCRALNHIWLASVKGAMLYNVSNEVRDTTPPSIFLTDVRIGRNVVKWDTIGYEGILWDGLVGRFRLPDQLVLSYANNHVTFDFGGLDWYQLEELRFEYYLEGLEDFWNLPSGLHEADYNNLPAGKYIFHLRSVNSAGLTSEEITYSFSIEAPFWQTWWFYLLLTIAGALVVIALIRARTKALLAKQVILEQIVSERTEELRHEKEIVEEKNKEIIDSINYAKRLQDAIIPSDKEFSNAFPDAFVLYRPKDIVAGDFYWMHREADRTLFAVADCTGHGVPGAIVSVVCSNALNRTVEEFGITEPGKILDRARELIQASFETSAGEVKDGMDVCLIAYNHETGKVSYAGANNPLWLYNPASGELQEYKATKQPVGFVDKPRPFESHTLSPQPGEVLYLFSDGYADQFGGERGKKFKSSNMKKLLGSVCDLPMGEQLRTLTIQFDEWKGNLEQLDDVCLVGIRV